MTLNTYVELASDFIVKSGMKMEREYYVSNKLNGMRAVWDGGISRGRPVSEIPWCNLKPYMKGKTATGLWTRNGKPIYACSKWLNQLPKDTILDGELWNEFVPFEDIISICREEDRNSIRWEKIEYHVFDNLPVDGFFREREIIDREDHWWVKECPFYQSEYHKWDGPKLYDTFSDRLLQLGRLTPNHIFKIVTQDILLNPTLTQILEYCEEANNFGYEGIMLRKYYSTWNDVRSTDLLRVKPTYDDEGIVIKVDLGQGRLTGMIGALVLQTKFGLVKVGTGLTDEQRALGGKFWLGRKVKYLYKDITKKGVPRHPSFGKLL